MSPKSPRSKRSAKSTAQQADRAYAEFERLTKKVTKSKRPIETEAETTDEPAKNPPS